MTGLVTAGVTVTPARHHNTVVVDLDLHEQHGGPFYLGVTEVPLSVAPEKTSPTACALTTPWVTVVDVDAVWLAVPAYVAVTDREPGVGKVVVQVAIPEAFRVWEPAEQPITVVPSLNVTVPVGTPPPGAAAATVAV